MADQRFTIVRIQFHQTIEVFLENEAPKLTLAHCDQVFVAFDSETWLSKKMITQISHLVYQHRLNNNDSFVSLLEVNVLTSIDSNDPLDGPNYNFLVGVVSLPDQKELICVTLNVNSLLGPSNKCFEITPDCCYPRAYHIISPSRCLSDYKCLMANQNGWIIVVNLSNLASSKLITSSQYVAIGLNQKIYYTKKDKSNMMHLSSNLPLEVLANGDGSLVKYGAILSNSFEQKNRGLSSNNTCHVFIGELSSPLVKFCSIQERLNLSFCFDQETVWPELPKVDDKIGEQKNEASKIDLVSNLEGDCSATENWNEDYFEGTAQQNDDVVDDSIGENLYEDGNCQNLVLPYYPPQVIYIDPMNYNSQVYLYPMANPYFYYNPQMSYYQTNHSSDTPQ